jgi:hypothetical protein
LRRRFFLVVNFRDLYALAGQILKEAKYAETKRGSGSSPQTGKMRRIKSHDDKPGFCYSTHDTLFKGENMRYSIRIWYKETTQAPDFDIKVFEFFDKWLIMTGTDGRIYYINTEEIFSFVVQPIT